MHTFQTYNTLGSKPKFDIGSLVRQVLLESGEVKAIVGEHIYPVVASENTDGPFINYRREKYGRMNVKQGIYEDDCTISITAVSDSYDESVALITAVDKALSGEFNFDTGRRIRIRLADSTEDFSEGKYLQIALYEVK